MPAKMIIRKAGELDFPAIKSLLATMKLPSEDLQKELPGFFIAEANGKTAGCIGLENYGDAALLRSMAVYPEYRNQGIASRLTETLLQQAAAEGVKEIYLLTETAENYFLKKGFRTISRSSVPDTVKKSSEFSHLCPSSATVMRKEISLKKKILFVCIENSNRSQMSQAFAKILGGDKVEAYSAGSRPSGKVNPRAIEAMKQLGYDLSTHDSKSLKDVERFAPFDAVVTMGCGDACPWMPARKFIDWQIPDPKHMEPDEFNKVRNLICDKVKELLRELEVI